MDERLDLLNPDLFVQGVPYDYFARLRAEEPIAWHDETNGPGYWLVTRYDDVVTVNKDWRRYSNEVRGSALEDPASEHELRARQQIFVNQDPVRHNRTRRLVSGAFTPRQIQLLTPQSRTICTGLVDEMLERGTVDFVQEISTMLAFRMVASMFGVPQDDWPMILRWTKQITNFQEPEYNPSLASRFEVQQKAIAYGKELVAQVRRNPAGHTGLITELVDAQIIGEDGKTDRLSDDEIATFILVVVIGGVDTTSHSLAEAVSVWADDPATFEKVAATGACPATLVEEVIRYATPAMNFRRTSTEDHEVAGVRIAAGDKVVMSFSSANRDERQFANADVFDPWRDPNEHVGFGGGGPHFCIGAHLARLDIRLMLDEMLRRVQGFELVGPTKRLRSNAFAGWLHYPVAVTSR
jgi:cholest-4-en-3-one 26-monooxygenase